MQAFTVERQDSADTEAGISPKVKIKRIDLEKLECENATSTKECPSLKMKIKLSKIDESHEQSLVNESEEETLQSASSESNTNDKMIESSPTECSNSEATEQNSCEPIPKPENEIETIQEVSSIASEKSCNEKPTCDTACVTTDNLFAYLSEIHREIVKRDARHFFALPVTDAIAPGYSVIIKSPMDLSTIYTKLQSRRHYVTVADYFEDCRLMFTNAMTYNSPETVYYQKARKLLAYCEKALSQSGLQKLLESHSLTSLSSEEMGQLPEPGKFLPPVPNPRPRDTPSRLTSAVCTSRIITDRDPVSKKDPKSPVICKTPDSSTSVYSTSKSHNNKSNSKTLKRPLDRSSSRSSESSASKMTKLSSKKTKVKTPSNKKQVVQTSSKESPLTEKLSDSHITPDQSNQTLLDSTENEEITRTLYVETQDSMRTGENPVDSETIDSPRISVDAVVTNVKSSGSTKSTKSSGKVQTSELDLKIKSAEEAAQMAKCKLLEKGQPVITYLEIDKEKNEVYAVRCKSAAYILTGTEEKDADIDKYRIEFPSSHMNDIITSKKEASISDFPESLNKDFKEINRLNCAPDEPIGCHLDNFFSGLSDEQLKEMVKVYGDALGIEYVWSLIRAGWDCGPHVEATVNSRLNQITDQQHQAIFDKIWKPKEMARRIEAKELLKQKSMSSTSFKSESS